jgi:hypothetical protein
VNPLVISSSSITAFGPAAATAQPETEKVYFIATEWCGGGSLYERLHHLKKPLGKNKALRYAFVSYKLLLLLLLFERGVE